MWKMLQSRFNLNFSFQHNLDSNLEGKPFVSYSALTGNKVDFCLLDIWIYVLLMHDT